MALLPSHPVSAIAGVGPSLEKSLTDMGINTIWDMLWHLPRNYEDRRTIYHLNQLHPEILVPQARVTITNPTMVVTRTGKRLIQAKASDETRTLKCLWFNQPYLVKKLKSYPEWYLVTGSVDGDTWINPQVVAVKDADLVQTILPVYPSTAGISQNRWHGWYRYLFANLQNVDPIIVKTTRIDILASLKAFHQPTTLPIDTFHQDTLGIFSHLLLSLASNLRAMERRQRISPVISGGAVTPVLKHLPFTLTHDQKEAIQVIQEDMSKSHPMNRLIQGDVGSGKTVVAQLAAYLTVQSDHQVIALFPTELLAFQQYQSWNQTLADVDIEVGLSTRVKKTKMEAPVVLGTHALLNQDWSQRKVGLVIIDEQHRFGVAQRAFFESLPSQPHVLTMSATPIPRTLAKTIAGDLSLTTITNKPIGRKPIKTWVVSNTKRAAGLEWIRGFLAKGQQAYVIYPLIEESETMTTIKAATKEYDSLVEAFAPYSVGLVHGRLKPQEKQAVFEAFAAGSLSVLVATSVVEVGVDVANATIIMIEGAERFGLSQLHQLRGRVGRGELQSYCVLFASNDDQVSNRRLQALAKYNDGFELAKVDLKERGPGEVFGLSQHGFLQLSYDQLTNTNLHNQAERVANELLLSKSLEKYPYLGLALSPYLNRPSTSKS